MKKMFTLIAAALMAVGVNAQGTFGLQVDDAAVPAGSKVTSVDNITMTWGVEGGADFKGGNKKSAVLESVLGSTAYCEGNGENGKPDAGTVYYFAPAQAGTLTVGVVLNGGKSFFIQDTEGNSISFTATDADGNAIELENGGSLSEKLTGGLMTFDVAANKTYAVYCTGSKLGFFGFKYTTGGVTPVEESGKKLVDMTGYNWISATWGQLEDGTWGNIYERLTEPNLYDYNRYYYNAAGQQAVERTSSQHYRYNYNADGTIKSRERWGSQGGVFCVTSVDAYEYDDAKNLVKTATTNYDATGAATRTSGSKYAGYEQGEYTVMTNFSLVDGVEQDTYETHYKVTFNEAGQLVDKIQMLKNNETGEFDTPNTFEHYVYENGVLTTKLSGYYNAEAGHEYDNVNQKSEYTYNADGTIKTRVDFSYGNYQSEVEWRYTYAEQDAAFVPQSVVCDGTIGNNEVYVKWDAVSGAEKYVVIYDNSEAEVEGKTEFITPLLNDGEHQVAVLAFVGGEQKNITDFVKVSVKDEGNLPMENFNVIAAEKVDVESYGYVNSYYNLTLSWDVPAGASAITDYTVYVDKQNGETWYPSTKYTSAMPQDEMKENYNDVNSWVTNRQNFYWTTFEDTYYDEDTWQTVSLGTGPTCKLWITATYATGESQKSNVVEVNIFNLANGGTDDVKAVNTVNKQAPVELFNVAGRQVGKANSRHQLLIVRQGNEVRKVLK